MHATACRNGNLYSPKNTTAAINICKYLLFASNSAKRLYDYPVCPGVDAGCLARLQTSFRPPQSFPTAFVYIQGGPKKRGHRLIAIILSNINRFQIYFFILRFLSKFAVKWISKIPLHFACVATLPCETLMSAKQAINDKLQGSVATYLRCGEVVNNQIKKGLLLSVSKKLKSVHIWRSYKQERDCFIHFARLANSLLKDEMCHKLQ